ncbi:putative minor tail protein [uncultured virus]|uniref:Putative minor tail protein n=1 Tax=uncultured virus TaxID=340016 RepID=A0A218MLH1_9VIRU|nr:putative minor tail protein [uncultured virus]
MTAYNFLKESNVHLVYGGSRYLLKTTPDVSFSQTFAEDAYEVKTLHDQTKMFQGTSITKANPADFSFTVSLTTEKDETIVKSLLTDYDATEGQTRINSFDLYIVSSESTFKLNECVITNGDFNLSKGSALTLTVSGQAQKLERVGNASYSLPGSLVSASSTRTPTLSLIDVEVGGSDVSNIISATLSVQNEIEWTPYETLHSSLSVTNASNAMYPSGFTLGRRVVSGNIVQYVTSNNSSTVQSFNTDTTVRVKTVVNGSTFLDANLANCMFTKRTDITDVFTQAFDYRLIGNPANLSTVITY